MLHKPSDKTDCPVDSAYGTEMVVWGMQSRLWGALGSALAALLLAEAAPYSRADRKCKRVVDTNTFPIRQPSTRYAMRPLALAATDPPTGLCL